METESESVDLLTRLRTRAVERGKTPNITVCGDSMMPFIRSGDTLLIAPREGYEVGEAVVFAFRRDTLVHRIVERDGDIYICKGDNSIRLERVRDDGIIGAVVSVGGEPLPPLPKEIVKMSYEVGRLHESGADISAVRASSLYARYMGKINEFFTSCDVSK